MRPIVIRWSLGETIGLIQAFVFALRHPGHRVMHNWWWLWREHGRRGTWEPWTIGDQIHLKRLSRYLAHLPRRHVRPGQWRH